MTGYLKGSATAMVTPFTEDGVDLESFGEMIDHQLENGTDALVVLGTTGEPSTMDEDEKDALVRFAVRRTERRAKVIVGVGHNCTSAAAAAAHRAKVLGADGVLAVTPYYNRCTQRGILSYYHEICKEGLPVIAYNVPSRTGVNILPETAEKLAAIDLIAGIKEASGDMLQVLDTARRIREKCDLYSGEDYLILPTLCAGGSAVISVVGNLVPRAVKELTQAALGHDLDRANALADALFPLVQACHLEVNPIPVKEAMNLMGMRAGIPRPPLTRLEPEHRALLLAAMQSYGIVR